ncbi:MAG: zinc ribbon domain-containing protein [Thermoleophilia bacterium]|nr:zinc ribbon domain-containing protein [Thermoleophilia bacterium]
MTYCSNCGKPLAEGQQFCVNCGQRVPMVEEAAPAQPVAPADATAFQGVAAPAEGAGPTLPAVAQAPRAPVAPPTSGGPSAPGAAPAEPPQAPAPPLAPGWAYGPGVAGGPGPQTYAPVPPQHRNLKWLWIALAALVVIAVACVLVFVVFDEKIFGDEETTETTISETAATTEPIAPTTTEDTTATTTAGGATTSEAATTTSEAATTTTETSGTTTTGETTSSTLGGGGAAKTPEDAVLLLFKAMEDKDFDVFFALMDPVAVEEVTGGLPLDSFKEYMGDDMWPWESMKFSDLRLETKKTSDTSATVTVVEGVVTVTEPNGVTSSESVTEAGSPVTFEVIQRDGSWYLDPETMFGATGL